MPDLTVTSVEANPPTPSGVGVVWVEASDGKRKHAYAVHISSKGVACAGVQTDPVHFYFAEADGIPLSIKRAAEKAWQRPR
jgi:hypothetical protein